MLIKYIVFVTEKFNQSGWANCNSVAAVLCRHWQNTHWLKSQIILEVQIDRKTINISKKMSVHETTDVAVCDSNAIPPWPTLRSRPGLWKQSPRNIGGLSAQSQNLYIYIFGGLDQAPKILVPVHSPGYGLVVGNHCSIQLTFHDFYMRFPTLPTFSLSTGRRNS